MKAVLLVNGRSILKHKHNIIKLHAEISEFAGDLLPSSLSKPDKLQYDGWIVRQLQEFLEHFYRYGNPDNRYLIFGYSFRPEDLFMLDQAVFAYRRLICRLDAPFIPAHYSKPPAFTNRDWLKESPGYFSHTGSSLPLSKLLNPREKSSLRDIAFNLNFFFAPSDYTHSSIEAIRSTRVPVLLSNVFDPLQSADIRQVKRGISLAEWTIENVKIPEDIKKELISAKMAAEKQVRQIDVE